MANTDANSDELAFLVLAAGEGTRMKSSLPKVLHPLAGRPLLAYPLALARACGARRTVLVVGSGADEIRARFAEPDVEFAIQAERLGTGHAVAQARAALGDHPGPVLITYGDMPLLRSGTITAMRARHQEARSDLTLLTAHMPDPARYGRVVRSPSGGVVRIVEWIDASEAERAICEINTGVYLADAGLLFDAVAKLEVHEPKGEYFLTDIVEASIAAGKTVEAVAVDDWTESAGINSRVDLADAERILRQRIHTELLLAGVTLEDPARVRVDTGVEVGADTTLAAGVELRGETRIGRGCRIDAGAVIESSTLGDRVHIKPHCHLEGARLADDCIAGPSAHLRPGADLGPGVRVGNFVEVKNAILGAGTKADHLSYIGDADVGAGCTFGCGSIIVNYDGQEKHRTTVGDGAFIGCNANLIAPVTIEPGAYVAAGSTITKPVPEGALAVGRARQRNVLGWRTRRFGED